MATLSISRAMQQRLSIASRLSAAVFGGYTLTSLLSIAIALLLTIFGMNKSEAILAVTMVSFVMYAFIVMAVFHTRTATRAWIGLTIASMPPAVFSAIYDRTIPWESLFTP
jgi:hypothetical protein